MDTEGVIRRYINSGHLKRDLADAQLATYDIIKVVTCRLPILRLLICGPCPGCSAPHTRNIALLNLQNTSYPSCVVTFPKSIRFYRSSPTMLTCL